MCKNRIHCFLIVCIFIYSPSLLAHKLKFVAESLPPFHYLDENQKPAGVLVEVIKALLDEANLKADIELLPFARAYDLSTKKSDVFMFSLLKTPNRAEKFKWVGKIYTNKAYLVGLKTRDDIKLQALNDAKKYTVGTIRGYYSETFLRQAGFIKKKQLYLTVNYTQLWGMLFKDRIDLLLTNTIALETELSSLGINSDNVNFFLEVKDFPSELYIASSLHTSNETIVKLSKALETIKKNKVYDKILKEWSM